MNKEKTIYSNSTEINRKIFEVLLFGDAEVVNTIDNYKADGVSLVHFYSNVYETNFFKIEQFSGTNYYIIDINK